MANLKMNSGFEIPDVGYGTWLIKQEYAAECVYNAIKSGYRHIDSAQAYGNEVGVGEGIRRSGIAREEIFVTSKVQAELKNYEDAKKSIDESIAKLNIGYIDLMLIHCPMPWREYKPKGGYRYEKENREVWRALEEAVKEGKVRSIGISNFNIHDTKNILEVCEIRPACNQIEIYAGFTSRNLIKYCKKEGIVVEAYSPIAHGQALENETLINMAKKYNVSVARLCIKYTLQLGTVSLPKARSLEHMQENIQLDFTISEDDMKILINLNYPIEWDGEED